MKTIIRRDRIDPLVRGNGAPRQSVVIPIPAQNDASRQVQVRLT